MSLNSFQAFALTRSEMKNVSGGTCYIQRPDGTNGGPCVDMEACKSQAKAQGTHYCCASCGSASWFNNY